MNKSKSLLKAFAVAALAMAGAAMLPSCTDNDGGRRNAALLHRQ